MGRLHVREESESLLSFFSVSFFLSFFFKKKKTKLFIYISLCFFFIVIENVTY